MASSTSIVVLAQADRIRSGVCAVLSTEKRLGQIVCAETPRHALASIRRHQPAVAIVDFDLACTELQQFLAHSHAQSPETRCLVMTDCQLHNDLAHKSGAHHVLRKGFSAEKLLETVNKLTISMHTSSRLERRKEAG